MLHKIIFTLAFYLLFLPSYSYAADADPNNWTPKGWTPQRIYQPIPRKAISTDGYDNFVEAYVCQATYGGKIIPGKVLTTGSSTPPGCRIAYYGADIITRVYSVLHNQADNNVFWYKYPKFVPFTFPGKLVVGGDENPGPKLFICKTQYYQNTVVGKYVPGHGCYFAAEGKEHLYGIYDPDNNTNFDVLLVSN